MFLGSGSGFGASDDLSFYHLQQFVSIDLGDDTNGDLIGQFANELPGEQLIEWGGALRWLVGGERADPARIRAWAKEQGGHATLFAGADKSAGVFQPLPAPVLALHERLKAGFDPHGILNPGRLYASL